MSDYEVRLLKEEGFAEEDIEALSEEDDETTQYVRQNLGYFIAYDNLYSTWLKREKILMCPMLQMLFLHLVVLSILAIKKFLRIYFRH